MPFPELSSLCYTNNWAKATFTYISTKQYFWTKHVYWLKVCSGQAFLSPFSPVIFLLRFYCFVLLLWCMMENCAINNNMWHCVYFQMERLIQELQHSKTGVPVKSQKTFLSVIPAVFTGKVYKSIFGIYILYIYRERERM